MPKVQVHELKEYSIDLALKKATKQFKNHCSIRRDLRKADEICNYIIKLHESIKSGETKLDAVAGSFFLVRASAMHAILLYSRWFKATTGKTMLMSEDFFPSGSQELSVHKKIVEHRDKYVAHNELDLLGADRIWVNTDDTGKFLSSDSDWNEQQWLQDKDLNMSTFQKCVHIVHNRIDTEIIPNRQKAMDRRLAILLGRSV